MALTIFFFIGGMTLLIGSIFSGVVIRHHYLEGKKLKGLKPASQKNSEVNGGEV